MHLHNRIMPLASNDMQCNHCLAPSAETLLGMQAFRRAGQWELSGRRRTLDKGLPHGGLCVPPPPTPNPENPQNPLCCAHPDSLCKVQQVLHVVAEALRVGPQPPGPAASKQARQAGRKAVSQAARQSGRCSSSSSLGRWATGSMATPQRGQHSKGGGAGGGPGKGST